LPSLGFFALATTATRSRMRLNRLTRSAPHASAPGAPRIAPGAPPPR
jgi:hypothetical protein